MKHNLLVGTFRHPNLYSLEFDENDFTENALRVTAKHFATGGHSWLHLSKSKDFIYCTGWTDPPSLTAYRLVPGDEFICPLLLNQAYPKYLSGYVTANDRAVYSASGPQGDVFALDPHNGGFATQDGRQDTAIGPVQSFSFLDEEGRAALQRGDNVGGIMDFGGLRHGGHSADLSPDGNRLYVADIGRNAIWTYTLDAPTDAPRKVQLGSKTISKRPNDGPRHVWPCRIGGGKNRVVYVLQEHSSYVDVYEHPLNADGSISTDLEWKQGVNILPPDADCKLYWADGKSSYTLREAKADCMPAEVRTSPIGDVLFASTRGLEPTEKGEIIAVPLDFTTGYITGTPSTQPGKAIEEYPVLHRWQTPTSGGWANAISVCPSYGRKGEVFLSLTDSEQGWVWILEWTRREGFEIVGGVNLNNIEGIYDDEGTKGIIGASVAVWYD